MRKSTDTLGRQWMLLRYIPRQPRKIDTTTLMQYVERDGFEVDVRTVQRDLNKLSVIFQLVCDDSTRPHQWSWMRDAEGFDLPRMDAHTALTFLLADQFLRSVMPHPTLHHLDPYFTRARGILSDLPQGGLAAWPEKVRVIPRGLPLAPPVVSLDALEQVYTCLLEEKRVEIDHRPRGSSKVRPMEVSPLGLVVRGSVIYLVATAWEYEDTRAWSMHRIVAARPTEIPRRVPAGFDLDAFISSGVLGFLLDEEPIELRALVHRTVAQVLTETPIADNQELEEQDDGEFLLRATLPYTMQLRGWILGYGDMIEVLEPASLRESVIENARRVSERYAIT